MRTEENQRAGRIVRRVLKVSLVAVVLTAAVGAAGSFSLNICPACNTNIRTQEPGEQIEVLPKLEAKPNAGDGDLPPMSKDVRRAP